MLRIILIAAAILALAGCESSARIIQSGSVELAPHTYAMSSAAFDAWAANHGRRQCTIIPIYSISEQCGGCFRPYPSTPSGEAAHTDLEGLTVWKPHGATICAIRCYDPHHLTLDDQCKLLHEEGHREDFALGSAGASHYWHLLCLMPNGAFFLTHPEINERLRREGFLK
jgi:hypothetical protein